MFINKIAKCIYRNIAYVFLIVLVIVLFFLNLDKQSRLSGNMVGTYVMGDEKSEDAEYFVLDKNNNYYRYKQFQFLEEGTYEEIYDNVFALNETENRYIVYNNEEIYYFDSDGVRSYGRIAEIPLFVNVPDRKDTKTE